MKRSTLVRAREAGILPEDGVERLWQFLVADAEATSSSLTVPMLMWYSGTALSVSALASLSGLLVRAYPQWGLPFAALSCAFAFIALAMIVRRNSQLRLLYGILLTGAVLMVPLFFAGLAIGSVANTYATDILEAIYKQILKEPLIPAGATIVASFAALYGSRFLFLSVPLVLGVWAILARLLMDRSGLRGWEAALVLSAATLIVVWLLDVARSWPNYGFWVHKCTMALLSFPIAHELLEDSEWRKIRSVCICLLSITVCLFLRRQSGILMAATGIYAYFAYLVFDLWKDLVWGCLLIVVAGFALVLIGLKIHKPFEAFQSNMWWRPRERRDALDFGAEAGADITKDIAV